MTSVKEPTLSQEQRLAQLELSMSQLQDENQRLKQQNQWFKKQLFGQKSEKRLVGDNTQASLFDDPSSQKDQSPPKETITYQRRKGKQRADNCITEQGLRFNEDVPVEVIDIPAPELQGEQAEQYEVIDEKVTHRLAQRPGSYVVLEYRRPVIKHKASRTLSTVPAPTAVLDNSIVDVSLLAGLLIDKFTYHLPLYRQHQRLQQSGITLSRTSLTNWVQRAIQLLHPIANAQLQQVLQSKVLAMDETPIKAGRKHKGKMKTTWFWPLYGELDEVVFGWSETRGSAYVEQRLKDFKGTLLTDGYAAYDCFTNNKPEITLAQCWAHTRRYFIKAQDVEPEAAELALQYIAKLYQNEAHIRKKQLNGQKKLDYRSQHSKSIVDDFFNWCYEQRQRIDLVNSNPLSTALTYVENHQAQLVVYLSDPDVPIDTNHIERALRPIPMGKKNWLFCWSEVGAEHVATIQTLLTTCKLQGVDPYRYLVDVLQRISLHPARDVIELTPRLWKEKFAANPLLSDLDRLGQ
jgi:transposase